MISTIRNYDDDNKKQSTTQDAVGYFESMAGLLLSRLRIPSFIIDQNGIVIGWNERMGRLSNLSVNDVSDQPIYEVIETHIEPESSRQFYWEQSIEIVRKRKYCCTNFCWFPHRDVDSLTQTKFKIRMLSMEREFDNDNDDVIICMIENEEYIINETKITATIPIRNNLGDRLNTMARDQDSAIQDEENLNICKETVSIDEQSNSFEFLYILSIPAFLIEGNGIIKRWNDEMFNLTGYLESDVYDCSIFDVNKSLLIWPSDQFSGNPSCLESIQEFLSNNELNGYLYSKYGTLGPNQNFEVVIKHKITGAPIRLSFRFSKVKDDRSFYVVFVQELNRIQPQQQLNSELSHSTYQNKSIATANTSSDNLSLGSVTFGTDSQGDISQSNKPAFCTLGYEYDGRLGKNIFDFLRLSDDLSTLLTNAFHDAVGKGLSTYNVEIEIKTKLNEEAKVFVFDFCPQKENSNFAGEQQLTTTTTTPADSSCQHKISTRGNELLRVIDFCEIPIFGVDRNGVVNEWNNQCRDVLGFDFCEAIGKPFASTYISNPVSRKTFEEVLQYAFDGIGTTSFELEIRSKWDEKRYLLLSATPRRRITDDNMTNNTTINGVVFFAQDMTEVSKHDRAIAAVASELRQLIDTANAPIFGIDSEGDINEWNNKTAEITGYSKEEAFDCSLVDTFIVPSMRDSVQAVLDDALFGHGTSNFAFDFRTKWNETRHLLVNATTRRDAGNTVVGVVCVAQDVTEAVQRDRAVAGMALELRQLIDTANAPIFGIDIDGNVNEWNRRTQEITGYSKEEAFDEPLVERFIAPHMRPKVHEILDAALHGNETSNYELEFVSKSGEKCFLLVNATTRRDPDHNVVGVVGVAQDVTEDRKHAAELREMHYLQATQEAKVETERNMTAYFAHELRNPLSAIDSALCAMPDDLPETATTLISGMKLCCSFMSSIMNNLLDVRKMEEGKMTLKVAPISLRALVTRVHTMLKPSVKHGVSFMTEFVIGDKEWVLGDDHRIQQVLTNVITNAMKYTVSGSIVIRVGWENEMVKFECIDTGPGIPKSEQEKLFQRFVQRGGAPGTGLGLVIAKHLVDLAGGTIRFESDPTVKAGTTCVVMMKLPECSSVDPENEVDVPTPMIEEALTFLIVDDIKMNRIMLKRRIQKGICPNCKVTEASTGEVALEICEKEKFDVVIVDHYMEEAGGVMVGTDVVYAMRRMKIDSIIIGCSGNDLSDEFTQAGADWVWQKPMPSNYSIITHLKEALAKKKQPSHSNIK